MQLTGFPSETSYLDEKMMVVQKQQRPTTSTAKNNRFELARHSFARASRLFDIFLQSLHVIGGRELKITIFYFFLPRYIFGRI